MLTNAYWWTCGLLNLLAWILYTESVNQSVLFLTWSIIIIIIIIIIIM